MKTNILAILVGFLVLGASYVFARTSGTLYGEALVIETVRGTQVASISTAGATATTGLTNTGAFVNTGAATISGQLVFQSASSTTIKTLTPAAVGALVYNSTRLAFCQSTATVAGAWVYLSSGPASLVNGGVTCKE
jgi:hypothetical protein